MSHQTTRTQHWTHGHPVLMNLTYLGKASWASFSKISKPQSLPNSFIFLNTNMTLSGKLHIEPHKAGFSQNAYALKILFKITFRLHAQEWILFGFRSHSENISQCICKYFKIKIIQNTSGPKYFRQRIITYQLEMLWRNLQQSKHRTTEAFFRQRIIGELLIWLN